MEAATVTAQGDTSRSVDKRLLSVTTGLAWAQKSEGLILDSHVTTTFGPFGICDLFLKTIGTRLCPTVFV